jgi:ABC-type lipoprotein release transport system permease subunit
MNEKAAPANKSYRIVGNPAAKRRRRRSFRGYAYIALAVVVVGLLAIVVVVAILNGWTVPHRR